jgi:hypothetical protein
MPLEHATAGAAARTVVLGAGTDVSSGAVLAGADIAATSGDWMGWDALDKMGTATININTMIPIVKVSALSGIKPRDSLSFLRYI